MTMAVDHDSARAVARIYATQADCIGNLARAYLATVAGKQPLTKRLHEIYDYLAEYIEGHGYAPTFEEIGVAFHYSSLATVHEHLSNLERKGWIRRAFNENRGITLVEGAEVAS